MKKFADKSNLEGVPFTTNQAEVTERAFQYALEEARKTGDAAFFLDVLAMRPFDAAGLEEGGTAR
jgi:hypothetical protein